MRHWLSVLVLAWLSLLCVSCVTTDYGKLPNTGFIKHYEKNTDERIPFVSYWDKISVEDWDNYVGRPRIIYLAPVTLEYFDNPPTDPEELARLEDLRDYFDARLNEELTKRAKKDPKLNFTRTPIPGVVKVEVAILSARSVNRKMLAVEDSANFLINGAGWLIRKCTGAKDETGHIAMGARLFDADGTLLCEVADYEYGTPSLTGELLLDTKDFRPYAYQRQTIDHWADEFATLAATPYEKKVHRPTFTLNPF